jgi:2'-5' RNA ligase
VDDPAAQHKLIREIARQSPVYGLAAGRCLTGVAFLPPALAAHIEHEVIEPLRMADQRHRFYAGDSLHLTLKNIRSVREPNGFTDGDAARALAALRAAAARFEPFEFELRPPMLVGGSLWIPALTRSPLRAFNDASDEELARAGLDDDKHYFSRDVRFGNITICRLAGPPSPALLWTLELLQSFARIHLPVNSGELVGCDIVCSAESRTRYGHFGFTASRATSASLPS